MGCINGLVLDFSDCIVDYPFTGQILDSIFQQLSNNSEPKELSIKTNNSYLFDEFFIGSKFLNLTDIYRLTREEIIQMIRKKLNPYNITLTVSMKDENIVIK